MDQGHALDGWGLVSSLGPSWAWGCAVLVLWPPSNSSPCTGHMGLAGLLSPPVGDRVVWGVRANVDTTTQSEDVRIEMNYFHDQRETFQK